MLSCGKSLMTKTNLAIASFASSGLPGLSLLQLPPFHFVLLLL